jgi:hypothetical protein
MDKDEEASAGFGGGIGLLAELEDFGGMMRRDHDAGKPN